MNPPTHRQDVLAAMRFEVLDQSSEHRDHSVPFVVLAEEFVAASGLDWGEIKVTPTIDNTASSLLVDRELGERWRAHHQRARSLVG